MHAPSRKALFALVTLATIISTGCSKKPRRPDPGATVIGQPGVLTPGGEFAMDNGLVDPNSMLTNRSGDPLDPANQIRGELQSVYFSFDQSAISAAERTKLDAAKTYLDSHPEQRLLIEGRADWRGTGDYNLGLGDRRAAAAKQYLVTLGVADTKIEVLSKGDLEAVENANDEIMAKDRRAELVILKK